MIRADTLGPVRLTVDGASPPPELLWRKHLALLIYLARSPRRTRSRDHLAGLFWGEKQESAARHSLNEALRVLRRSLPEEGLDATAEQIRLGPDAVELDVDRLTGLVERDDLEPAAGLIVGPFLEGFGLPGSTAFEDWLAAERQQWAAASVRVLVGWSRALLDRGRTVDALAAADRAIRLAPVAEPPVEAALRAAALLGDRAGALARFENYAVRLDTELGARPASAVAALAERIRSQPARAPVPPADGERELRRPPLAGRARELGQLVDWWRACHGRAGLAILRGELGLGKSRLLEELATRARLDGGVVAAVRAVSTDRTTPGSTVVGLAATLHAAPGVAGASPAAIRRFGHSIPEWAARFADHPGAADISLARALAEVVRTVAEERPVLVIVDDADWLDEESARAIESLVRDLASSPVLAILARSPHVAHETLDRLEVQAGRDLEGGVLRLGPLDAAGIAELAGWAFPGFTAAELERVARRLATDSAGIPLLAAELATAVAEGLDEIPGAAWPEPLKTLDDSMPADLPEGIVAALRIGFRRLSKPGQSVLAAAALLNDRFDPDEIAELTGLTAGEADAALDELEWNRWLAAEPRGYSFVARIAREVIRRDMLTPGQRRRLEDRVKALRDGGRAGGTA